MADPPPRSSHGPQDTEALDGASTTQQGPTGSTDRPTAHALDAECVTDAVALSSPSSIDIRGSSGNEGHVNAETPLPAALATLCEAVARGDADSAGSRFAIDG